MTTEPPPPPPPDAALFTGYGFPFGQVRLECWTQLNGERIAAQYTVPAELWVDDDVMQESVRTHVRNMLAAAVLARLDVCSMVTVCDEESGFFG